MVGGVLARFSLRFGAQLGWLGVEGACTQPCVLVSARERGVCQGWEIHAHGESPCCCHLIMFRCDFWFKR